MCEEEHKMRVENTVRATAAFSPVNCVFTYNKRVEIQKPLS